MTRDLSDALEAIEGRYHLPDAYRRCIGFMLAGLRYVLDRMPSPVQEAAAAAVRYWDTDEKDTALEVAKVELWRHLDSGGLQGPAESGARAVLCVLEATPPTADIVELLDWYVQFLSGAGAQTEQILKLIRDKFP